MRKTLDPLVNEFVGKTVLTSLVVDSFNEESKMSKLEAMFQALMLAHAKALQMASEPAFSGCMYSSTVHHWC